MRASPQGGGARLVAAMTERPEIRGPVIRVLEILDCHEAIDPLIAIAGQDDRRTMNRP